MKYKIYSIILLSLLTLIPASSNAQVDIVGMGLSFIKNPSDLFFNLHLNTEDVSPNLSKRRFAFRINMTPALLPATMGSIAMKLRLTNNSGYVPQLDFSWGYGKMLALAMMSSEDAQPENKQYYYALTVTHRMNDRTRIYWGYKTSEFSILLKFKDPVKITEGSELSQLNFIAKDNFIFTGIEQKTDNYVYKGKEQVVIAQMGYGLESKKIIARLGVMSPHVEFGLDIFPESIFIFHPYWAYHWRF